MSLSDSVPTMLGHPLVVAAEEGEEVLRQVVLVVVRQRADDAEVQRDPAAEVLAAVADVDVAGVHVGVEEAVAQRLREEDLDGARRQLLDVDAGLAQPRHLAHRDAVHALHHDDVAAAVVPVHLGHPQQPRAGEVAPQLRAVGGLAHQVQFVVQVLVELGHHFARAQPLAVAPQLLHQQRAGLQQRQVLVDRRVHAGPQHLDRDLAAGQRAAPEHGEVHLRDRGAGHRLVLEAGEHLVEPAAEAALDLAHRQHGIERRHAVLQGGEFVGDVGRQQVAPGRKHLAELDEDRPEVFQCPTQPHAARLRQAAAERDHAHQPLQPRALQAGQDDLVQSEAKDREEDAGEAEDAHPAYVRRPVRSSIRLASRSTSSRSPATSAANDAISCRDTSMGFSATR